MRRRAFRTVLVAGTSAVLAFGGGIAAWANWSTGTAGGTGTARVARIPVMAQPRAEMSDGSPRIAWDEVTVHGVPVDQYVVVRSDGRNRRVVCAVRTGVTACRDTTVAPGSAVQYYVHATLGAHWVGKNSEPSEVIAVPESVNTLVSDARPATDSGKTDAKTEDPGTPAPGKEPEIGPSPPEETPAAATSTPASTSTSAGTAEPSAAETSGPQGQGGGSESPDAGSEGANPARPSAGSEGTSSERPGAGSGGQGGSAPAEDALG